MPLETKRAFPSSAVSPDAQRLHKVALSPVQCIIHQGLTTLHIQFSIDQHRLSTSFFFWVFFDSVLQFDMA